MQRCSSRIRTTWFKRILQKLPQSKDLISGSKEGQKQNAKNTSKTRDTIKKPKAPWPTEVTASDSSQQSQVLTPVTRWISSKKKN